MPDSRLVIEANFFQTTELKLADSGSLMYALFAAATLVTVMCVKFV